MAQGARARRRARHGGFTMERVLPAGVRLLCCGLLAGAFVAGCASPAPRTAADRAARAQQLIDSGNAAYRQGDYRLASRRYAAAAVERTDDPAAYYGMGMALAKLGRDEEARAAYQRARDLAQAAGGPAGGAAGAPPATHP